MKIWYLLEDIKWVRCNDVSMEWRELLVRNSIKELSDVKSVEYSKWWYNAFIQGGVSNIDEMNLLFPAVVTISIKEGVKGAYRKVR